MGFHNTKYLVGNILDSLGGIPEECSWIDYKAGCEFDREFREGIKSLVVAFLNSIQAFDKDKYIIFGIFEDKKMKKKTITGLQDYKFPDDNEWQNTFTHIQPFPIYTETGTLEYKGLLLGYICIFAQNYKGPYYYSKKKNVSSYPIRRGGNKYEMTEEEKSEFTNLSNRITQNGRIYVKSEILNILVTLGKYNSSNQNDINLIEDRTGKTHDDVKQYCLKMDNLFTQEEKSIYGLRGSITVEVQEKHSRLLQFSSDEVIYALEFISCILKNKSIMYSHELFEGIADTLIFFADHGYSYAANQVIESIIDVSIFKKSRYPILSQMAEVSPAFLLNLIMEYKTDIMEKKHSKENAMQVLRTVAWYPEHYAEATKLLIEFGDQSVYELFECGEIASATCFDQKLNLIKEIVKNDADLAFHILNKVLDFNPKIPKILSYSYVPEKYKRWRGGTHSFKIDQLQTYFDIMVDIAGTDAKKILELLPQWLKPYPFSNLQRLAECIERAEPVITSSDERVDLWYRLCVMPLVYVTDEPVDDVLKEQLVSVGKKFKPDSLLQQQQWFRESIRQDLSIDGSEWHVVCEKIFNEQKKVLLAIYKEGGIKKLIDFVQLVYIDSFQLAKMLLSPDFSLTIEDDNMLVLAFLDCPIKYKSYFSNKSYSQKIDWIKNLNIERLDINEKAGFFAVLDTNIENIKYFEEQLGNNGQLYWENVDSSRFSNELSIQYGFKKFIEYNIPQKAFGLLEPLQTVQMEQSDPNWLFDALIEQEKYDDCYLSMGAYEFAYRILYGRIDENKLERMEHLSFKLYGRISYYISGYAGFKPLITFKRISNDPTFFTEIVKYIINDSFSIWNHILKSCDQGPESSVDWIQGINNLTYNETDIVKKKMEYWEGFILFNVLDINSVGDYEISVFNAELLNESEDKRNGFYFHAYYSLNGFHANGSFEYDSKDRKDADRYKKLAVIQEERGNTEFSKMLYTLSEDLINSLES